MKSSHATPDLIVLAGRCESLSRSRGKADALAVAEGRIVAIGARREIRALKRRRTKVVDLGDAVLTPGLVDCHTHFLFWALYRARAIDVGACTSLDETLARIRRQARRRRFGEWIVALGFNHNAWDATRLPTASDLDTAVPDRPVLVRSRDWHTAWLNSAALRALKISARTPDPPGGRYLRDERGRPTGIAQEKAALELPDPVERFAARHDARAVQAIDRALDEACCAARACGLTGIHSVDGALSLAHFQRRHAERRTGLRVVHAIPRANFEHACKLGLRSGLGDAWLRLGGVKIFADGALGSQTAYMFDPYPDTDGFCGLPVVAGDELHQAAVVAARHGWPLWVHAIGDRAVSEVIDAIAAARRVETRRLPHRIEHVQCIRPADAKRMARLGIIASVQPCHIMGDIATAQRHWPRACRRAYALRTLLDAGVTLAMGSDVPIESIDPRRSLFGAVCRTDEQGQPAGGWYPQQSLTPVDVLRGFTRGAALAGGGDELEGTLRIGAPADLTIWLDDPLRHPPEELRDVRIGGCIVGGEPHLDGG